jgi:hypothetical protein
MDIVERELQAPSANFALSVAILGWGSLTYDWHGLSLVEPVTWHENGPSLPIEFSRISKDRRLTAVIDERNGEWVRTRYAASALDSIERVIEQLLVRERTTKKHWIGFVDLRAGTEWSRNSPAIVDHLRRWLQRATFDAVVWTDIPPDFGELPFSIGAAVAHFLGLDEAEQAAARNYVAWAPREVDTAVRRALKKRGQVDDIDPQFCGWPPHD